MNGGLYERFKIKIFSDDLHVSLLNWNLFAFHLNLFERLFDIIPMFEGNMDAQALLLKFTNDDMEQFLLDLGNFLIFFKGFDDLQVEFSGFLEKFFLFFHTYSGTILNKPSFMRLISIFKYYGVKEISNVDGG